MYPNRTHSGALPGVLIWLGLFLPCVGMASSTVKQLLNENRLEEALIPCGQLELIANFDRQALFACAWVYYRSNRLSAAEKAMERLRKVAATSPEFQLLSGYKLAKQKKYDEAKKLIGTIQVEHRNTPTGITAQELYAEVYELMGQLDTAAFLYKQVVGDDTNRPRAHWGLGRHYLARGDAVRAVSHLENAAKMWPKHVGSRFNLGVIYFGEDNLVDAGKWFGECYKLNRADPGVLEYLGLLFEKKGNIKEAVRYWQRTLDINKESAIAKEKLSQHYVVLIDDAIDAKDYKRALNLLKVSGKFAANQPNLLLRRGIIKRNMNEFEKASGDLLAYVATNPNDPLGLRELGIAYLNLTLLDEAGAYFVRAIAAEPDNGVNHAWLAFVLEGKQKFTEARDEWRKAIELLRDPSELEKATRKLASIERRLNKGK